ncbi:Purine nucleoside phosphorylase 1 [Planctomycetes bacterium Pla163]|uniref:purine-nucleoside phosphorylase n=1 Tax=Rohdeia mirabilis TaxID=2528008 RepID=A0A518CV16_9BACT|nr:Purine nucleoside phosphorylase 1 [Planctomycetes bacterium Pla163]
MQPVDTAQTLDRAARIADTLREQGVEQVDLLAVLGSGLGGVADALDGARSIPFDRIEDLPRSTVPGHAGEFRVGRLDGRTVLVQCGRVHLYEGHHPRAVTLAVRAAAQLGASHLFLTNASGCLRTEWAPGTWMRIADQLDLQAGPALLATERSSGTPWCAELGRRIDAFAERNGLAWPSGVYAGLVGPTYETPSEVRALQAFGADAVGMSTVKEAAVGHALGLRVAGLSCLTNLAAGLAPGVLAHEEVVDVGGAAAARLATVLPDLFRALLAADA